MKESQESLHIDRNVFSVLSGFDDSPEIDYWSSHGYLERLQAIEIMRQINYGNYKPSGRLQRVLEIAELKTS